MKVTNLTNRTKTRISSAILFLLFGAGIFAVSEFSQGLRLDPFMWVLLVFAAAFGGSAVAYMSIGDWIRWPFTKEVQHSSNSSMIEIEPKYEGWLKSFGLLLCCPICAGAWVVAVLLGLLTINYDLGYFTIIALSAGGALRVVVRLSEMLEWQSRYAQEKTAELNRKNALEESLKNAQKGDSTEEDSLFWVVTEDDVKSDV